MSEYPVYEVWTTLPAGSHIDLPDDVIQVHDEVTLYTRRPETTTEAYNRGWRDAMSQSHPPEPGDPQ
jgi:hypothetical protein